MFMYPEPSPNQFRLRNVTLSTIASELHSPDVFPRCTQSNLGLYAFPLSNIPGEYDVKKVEDVILNRWAEHARAWWVDKPSDVSQTMFELHKKTKDDSEFDPRFQCKISLFPRSYQYEMDCMKEQRQERIRNKVIREESFGLKEPNSDEKKAEDVQISRLRWQKQPDVFGKSQEDPCKRRQQFQTFGQSYRTEACRFYYDNYPPPPLSKHLKKFGI